MRNSSLSFALLFLAACGGEGPHSGARYTGDDAAVAGNPDAGKVVSNRTDAGTGGDAASGDELDSGAGDGAVDEDGSDAGGQALDAGSDAGGGGDAGGDAGDEPDAGPELTEDQKLAAAVEDKLRACGVVGDGTFSVGTVADEFDRCVGACTLEAECADLKNALCRPGSPDSAYGACSGACVRQVLDDLGGYPSDGFACDTGDVIPHTFACDDGVALDCNDFRTLKRPVSEDEANCPKFTCTNGTQISERFRCDGLIGSDNGGCADGSDETGCATYCQ